MAMINDPFGIMNSNYDMRSAYSQHAQIRSVEELRNEEILLSVRLHEIQQEKLRRLETSPLNGPTPRQLNEYPALKSLWDEIQITMQLCGIKNV